VLQVDIFYIHMPDHSTPISETLAGVQEVYNLGLFRRFGLSNYLADDVQSIHNHCQEHGYVLPTVYQGSYSPITRHRETDLLPTLRRLGMAFYAYSPSASGFLAKTPVQVEEAARAAEATGAPFRRQYIDRPAYMAALGEWGHIATSEGIDKAEMAYRWVAFHSALKRELGDALIIGASSFDQLENTLSGIERGSLSVRALKGINSMWEGLKHEPPAQSFPPSRSVPGK